MARKLAIVAALVGGAGWITKFIVLSAQGGPELNSAPENMAFFIGLVGVVIAASASGVHIERTKPVWRRVLAGIAGIVALALVISLGQWALPAMFGDGWVPEEAIFGIVGLLAVVAALLAFAGPRRARGLSKKVS